MTPELPPTESFWLETTGERLAQGDYLPNCPVPVFPADYTLADGDSAVPIRRANLIVVTQSCDLENNKVGQVAMCPIFSVPQLKRIDDKYGKPERLEEIHSLPVLFLGSHAGKLGKRWRLKPPYLEHFSQAFARFFMRVGLPSAIRRFK